VNTCGTCIATILQGCLILVLFLRPVSPQANAASVRDGSIQIEVNVNDVVVPAVVRDAQGRAVGNLKSQTGGRSVMGATSQYYWDAFTADSNVMAEPADGTGGSYFHNSNDLEGGFRSLTAAPEYMYPLEFPPKKLKLNGTYHPLKVNVHGDGMQARRGYFAPHRSKSQAPAESNVAMRGASIAPAVSVAVPAPAQGRTDQTQTERATNVPPSNPEINQAPPPPGDEAPPSSVSSAAEQANPPPSQAPKPPETPQATSGQSTMPAPNRPVKLIPRSAEVRERTYRAEHHVILNVFVADASGNPVTGLKQEDFTLLDNQQPQQIASFKAVMGSTPMAPAHVLLMLDSVNNSTSTIAYAGKELEKFLGRNQGSLAYPVSIVRLTDSGTSASQPSRDGNALIGELRMLPNDVHVNRRDQESPPSLITFGPLFDPSKIISPPNPVAEDMNQRFLVSIPAVAGLAAEQEDVPGRVILVWIGPGWPLLSGPGILPDTPEIKRNFFAHIVDLSTELREAQMTVDAVSSPKMLREAGLGGNYYQAFLNGVTTVDQAKAGNLALPVLAYQSGGQVLEKSKDLAAAIDRCIADAGSYYVLSFDSVPAANPDQYRSLQVKVNKPGLTARTNMSYYARP
jgi:VWFA-related protein